MTTLRTLLPAARSRIERRKAILGGLRFGSGMIAGSVAGQAFLDPLLEPVAQPVREAVWGRAKIETFRANEYSLDRIETHGNDHQRATFAAYRDGRQLPAFVVERATMTYPGPAGDQWVEWQGDVASNLLWGARQPRDVPMRARPDRAFGEWAERRLREWRGRPEPVYARIVGDGVEQSTGVTRPQDYTIFAVQLRKGKVLTVSAPWPGGTPGATPRRDPTRHDQRSEAPRDLHRSASI